MDKFTFFDLRVYKEAKLLVKEVYELMESFPNYEKYALGDQLRRAVVSVPSNIAEGSGRSSVKEKIHFLEIAYGSLTETLCQLDIANDLGYININQFNNEKERISVIGKQLSGLRVSFQKQLNANR
jgi:four helix bundle protein